MKFSVQSAREGGNMFMRLHALLDDVAIPGGMEMLDLSIGEPQIEAGDIVKTSVAKHNGRWQYYPRATSNPRFTRAVEGYIARRWPSAAGLVDVASQMLPVPGSRSPLSSLGSLVRGTKARPVALVANPGYNASLEGAQSSGGEIRYLNSLGENGYVCDPQSEPEDVLGRTVIVYLCSPGNPNGAAMSMEQIKRAIRLARKHEFLLVMDECYCDIWRGTPPAGTLEAAAQIHAEEGGDGDPLRCVVATNTLSKRSSAAGLRAGFIVGDAEAIANYTKLAAGTGALMPLPILETAADLYEDEAHVAGVRAHYDRNFDLAREYLGLEPPQGGMFAWMEVGDDVDFTLRLMRERAVRVMPGSFMAETSRGVNPGAGHVRLALVHDHERTRRGLERIADFVGGAARRASG